MERVEESDVVDCIECCECAVPVGTDGPQRAALLLPCQHVMHLSCIEFAKRRMKLLKLYEDAKPNSFPHDIVCRGCQQPVNGVIPLFTTSGTLSQPSADEDAAKSEFELIHHAQKQYLRRLQRMLRQKANVTRLSHQCAALHIQRTDYLRDVDQHNQLFPKLKPMDLNSSAQGSFAALSFNNMTTTELELYLMQTMPALNETQTTLLEKRRVVEKHRQTLLALKEKYHARKKAVRLEQKNPSTSLEISQPSHTPQPAAFQGDGGESTGRVLSSPNDAAVPLSARSSRKRCGDAVFVDVDEDEESITSRREGGSMRRLNNPGSRDRRQRLSQPDLETVVVSSGEEDDDDADVVECGDKIPTARVANNHPMEEVDYEKETSSAMLFPRWVGGRDTEAKVQMRQLQLLPRRENYLWQSSLPF
ncbi:unnamed protein product [Phytomonas sp. EM1]|nr:unnamed protein product [Phytomonas sp. EM1]|eukprot:CCW60167.1 unnamed protein product [Phytomonas sp. isolate EM1]